MFEVRDRSLLWRGGTETLLVEPWGEGAVRVRSRLGDVIDTDWALLPAPETDATVTVDGIPMPGLLARFSKTPGRIRWAGRDARGEAAG